MYFNTINTLKSYRNHTPIQSDLKFSISRSPRKKLHGPSPFQSALPIFGAKTRYQPAGPTATNLFQN